MACVDEVKRRVSGAILSGIDGADKVKCSGCGVTSLCVMVEQMMYSNIMFNTYLIHG